MQLRQAMKRHIGRTLGAHWAWCGVPLASAISWGTINSGQPGTCRAVAAQSPAIITTYSASARNPGALAVSCSSACWSWWAGWPGTVCESWPPPLPHRRSQRLERRRRVVAAPDFVPNGKEIRHGGQLAHQVRVQRAFGHDGHLDHLGPPGK